MITPLLAQSLLLGLSWKLRQRARARVAAARRLFSGGAQADPLVAAVAALVEKHLDQDLCAGSDSDPLAAMPVPSREPHDPYTTAAELVRFIQAQRSDSEDRLDQHERLIKALYQLQDALGLATAALGPALDLALQRLRSARLGDATVGAIELLRPGDLVDRSRMWPLSQGTRVRQPLGVVVRDTAGRIISRAKVLCR